MAQVIYAAFGPQPRNPVNQTAKCDQCEPTMRFAQTALVYDTEADARTTAQTAMTRNGIFAALVPRLWTQMWNQFRCTNAACGSKRACGNAPTHLGIGARTVLVPRPPAGVVKWEIVVAVAREIKCVAGPVVPDVTPTIPVTNVLNPPVFISTIQPPPAETVCIVTTPDETTVITTKPRKPKKKVTKKAAKKTTKRARKAAKKTTN